MKIAVIGAGNMGGAIAAGLLDTGFVRLTDIVVVDPYNRDFEKRGVSVYSTCGDFLRHVDTIIIAVKPWLAKGVMAEVANVIGTVSVHISICSVVAGLNLDEMGEVFKTQPLFRIMPNTAVRVGEGMTFIAHQRALDAEVKKNAKMFETLGRVMVIDEKQIDACMALASCGVAYALRYVRAAMEGGVELGVSAVASQEIVVQTLRGAAALLIDGSHPEVEIDKVTTPGGITIKGLNAMEEYGFTNAVIQGLKASK